MRRLDVEAHGAVRDPLPGKAVDEDPDILDAGLRQGPAPDPQMSGTDAHRIRPGHVASRQDGAGLRGGWGRRRRDRPGGARLRERRGRLFVDPGRWSIQIALQVGDRLHHLGHRLDQLPMPAQALPVGERGAFLLSGQGRLPGRAVRLQRPVQLAAQLLGELAVGRGHPIVRMHRRAALAEPGRSMIAQLGGQSLGARAPGSVVATSGFGHRSGNPRSSRSSDNWRRDGVPGHCNVRATRMPSWG